MENEKTADELTINKLLTSFDRKFTYESGYGKHTLHITKGVQLRAWIAQCLISYARQQTASLQSELSVLKEENGRFRKEIVDLKEVYDQMDIELGGWYLSDKQNQQEIKLLQERNKELEKHADELAAKKDKYYNLWFELKSKEGVAIDQSELSALQERNKKLEEALRELHSCTLYKLGPGDERDTHAPWQLFDKVVQALSKESNKE
jgi:chromosome segregation ATPase